MKFFTVFLFILFSNSPTYAEKINDKIDNNKNIDNNQYKNFKTRDLKKLLTNCEKKISKYEKQKSILENEMSLENFYQANNQKRIQEVNIELRSLIDLIIEEEKIWEDLVVKIEDYN